MLSHLIYNFNSPYIQIYYFISSKGVIQKMPITEKHSKEFAFAYRKAIGNYFETKEAVQEKLDSIKKTMYNR